MPFAKLSDIQQFTVQEYKGFTWKKWDVQQNKPITSPQYMDGFQKKYQVETEHGTLDLSPFQMGSMLCACLENNTSLKGTTYSVKTTQKDPNDPKTRRYYINIVRDTQTPQKPTTAQPDAPQRQNIVDFDEPPADYYEQYDV